MPHLLAKLLGLPQHTCFKLLRLGEDLISLQPCRFHRVKHSCARKAGFELTFMPSCSHRYSAHVKWLGDPGGTWQG